VVDVDRQGSKIADYSQGVKQSQHETMAAEQRAELDQEKVKAKDLRATATQLRETLAGSRRALPRQKAETTECMRELLS